LPTVCFLDNDALLKLVAGNLFWEAISSLGITQADLRVLPTAKFYFRKSRRLRQVYPESILERTLEVVNACYALTPTVDEELQRLQVVEGIDPGEAVLIVATKTEPSFYLVTGDKRCLIALATAGELKDIRHRLKGRVICVEQLILRVIETQGFERGLTKVLPARDYDTAIKSIFGSGERATRENVLSALDAYIQDLRQVTEGLLADI
jgi:hypothetical protein